MAQTAKERTANPARRQAPPVALLVATAAATDVGLIRMLVEAGLTVDMATEDQVLARRGAMRPAVLVLDDHRPLGERASAQLRLRSLPTLRGVPVVVLSEDCSIDSFGGAIARGASAFLRAPVDRDELRDVARRLAAWSHDTPAADVRRARRRPLLLGADVDVPERGLRPGLIVDVSATGCRLELPDSVPAGTSLGIVPRSCDGSTEIRLGAVVGWSRKARSGYAVAVKWTGASGIVARRMLGVG